MMMRLSALLLFAALTGCLAEEVKTTEYYTENHAKRVERLKACGLQHNANVDANCVNARKAQRLAQIRAERRSWQKMLASEKSSTTQ